MGDIDAIVSARFDSERLVLAGRKIPKLGYRGIRVDDVAALWQSEMTLQEVEAEVRAFEDKWSRQTWH